MFWVSEFSTPLFVKLGSKDSQSRSQEILEAVSGQLPNDGTFLKKESLYVTDEAVL